MDIVIKDKDGNPYPTDFASVREMVLEQIGLVGQAEIAERAGVKPNTIRVWLRRHADFPKPAAELAMGPVWFWEDVRPWVNKQLGKQAIVKVTFYRHDQSSEAKVMSFDELEAVKATFDTTEYHGFFVGIPSQDEIKAYQAR